MLNNIELNIILYYADYLSLKQISIPVTDNCKYYFIYETPINSAYIVGLEPLYDAENPYFQQAYMEYATMKQNLEEGAINSFVDNICNLRALGCVNAEDMLRCIHQFDNKADRKVAFDTYNKWRSSQTYTHTVLDDMGDEKEEPCTRYVAHYEYTKYPQKRIRYTEEVDTVGGLQKSAADSKRVAAKNN